MKAKQYLFEILIFALIFALVMCGYYFLSKKVSDATQRDAVQGLREELSKKHDVRPSRPKRNSAPAPVVDETPKKIIEEQPTPIQPNYRQKVRQRGGVVDSDEVRNAGSTVEAIETYYSNTH